MLTWETLSITILVLLTAGLTGYVVLLRGRYAGVSRTLANHEAHRQDLVNLSRLLRLVTEADWKQYPAVLTKALITSGYGQRAALLTVRDEGQLEVLASRSTEGITWEPRSVAGLGEALERKERVLAHNTGALCLPVPEGGEIVGVLVLEGGDWLTAESERTALIDSLAGIVHLALIDQRVLNRQFSLSTTDGLTGLLNHRHFQQTLSVHLAQSYLEHTSLALIMLDIDHFKKLNDTYGHLFGDLVLREVAGVVRRTVPARALAARYGGEEFAIALPDHSLADAAGVAEQVRAAIEAHRVNEPNSGEPVSVTVSGGVSAYKLGMGRSKLVARADEALYASKQGGRNRITVLDPDERN